MNILAPQGPVAAAEKVILIDSIAIMLAIVVPTIAAILAFAFWFRRSNPRATYLPDWEYSGEACSRNRAGRNDPGRLARLEVAIYLSRSASRLAQLVDGAGRLAASFRVDVRQRDECVFRAVTRQHDLHDERHGDASRAACG